MLLKMSVACSAECDGGSRGMRPASGAPRFAISANLFCLRDVKRHACVFHQSLEVQTLFTAHIAVCCVPAPHQIR